MISISTCRIDRRGTIYDLRLGLRFRAVRTRETRWAFFLSLSISPISYKLVTLCKVGELISTLVSYFAKMIIKNSRDGSTVLVCRVTCKLPARSLQACWFGELKFIVIFFVFSYLTSTRLIVWDLKLMSFFLLLRLSYKVRCYIWTKFLCLNFNLASCEQWRTSHLVSDKNFTFYSNIHWGFPFHSHNFSAHFCGIVVYKLSVFFLILCMMIPHFAKASTRFFIFPFQ